MEGLIPFVFKVLKKNKLHQHSYSYKSLSDSSRRSYHLLLGGGDSVNGSSHRRTQSEFQPPSSTTFFEYGHQELNDSFSRSRSLNKDPAEVNRANQIRSHAPAADRHPHPIRDTHSKCL